MQVKQLVCLSSSCEVLRHVMQFGLKQKGLKILQIALA